MLDFYEHRRLGHFFPKIIQPSRTPRPRVSKVGIHIQLNPPLIHPCPILYPPIHRCPIIPPPIIDPVIAPPPKIRKSTTTTTNAMTRGVLLDSFMTLISCVSVIVVLRRLHFHFHLLLHLHLLARFAPTVHFRHHAEVFEQSISMCRHFLRVWLIGLHICLERTDLVLHH